MKVNAYDDVTKTNLNISIKNNKIKKIVGVETITNIERIIFQEKNIFNYVYKVYYGRNYYVVSLNSYQNFIFLWGLRKNWLRS